MTVIGVTLQFIDKSCTPINSRISAVAVDDSVPVINPKANTHLFNMIKPIRVMYVSPVSINLQCQVTLHFPHMRTRRHSWVSSVPAEIFPEVGRGIPGTVYLFPNSNSGGAAEINEQKGADQFKGVF